MHITLIHSFLLLLDSFEPVLLSHNIKRPLDDHY